MLKSALERPIVARSARTLAGMPRWMPVAVIAVMEVGLLGALLAVLPAIRRATPDGPGEEVVR
jgi:hypothetical protein